MTRTKHIGVTVALISLALATVPPLISYIAVGRPIAQTIEADSRNVGFTLRARYRYFVDPTTLVLDLKAVERAAPVDLLRAVFQAAEAMHDRERHFKRVILARKGTPVFLLEGEDFAEIGEQYDYGENPVYMVRKFPSKLYNPDGSPAYGEWTGGLLGVISREMNDVTEATHKWAGSPVGGGIE